MNENNELILSGSYTNSEECLNVTPMRTLSIVLECICRQKMSLGQLCRRCADFVLTS